MHSFKQLIVLVVMMLFAILSTVAAQTVSVSSFASVQVRDGASVVLRHGSSQKVTLLKGSLDHSSVTTAGGVLTIAKCNTRCPRDYSLLVEIVSPVFDSVSVTDGGKLESKGSFPTAANLEVAVSNGGSIDVRSMITDMVNASVREGGVILARPQSSLIATVFNGGQITYWGEAKVKSSVENGGVVSKGKAADIDRPVSELDQTLSALPPVPPVPAAP